jgi:hypothetical protein
MRTAKKISIAGGTITLIAVILLLAMVPLLHAQQFNYQDITRSKLWARIWNTSGVGQPTAGGETFYKFDYPGHLITANTYEHYGMCEWSGYMTGATVDGVGKPFRVCMAYDPNPTYIAAIEPATLTKNYNLADPSVPAEEILTGANKINEYGVEMHFRVLAWSFPKYSDFLIYEYVFTNTGGKQITDFYFAPTAELAISTPMVGGWRDDDDYEWDLNQQAFYFHDGRQWDTDDQPVVEGYGLTRSDLGDPADLGAPAAIDHEFLSPQYFTYYWLEKPVKSDPGAPDYPNIVDKNNLNQQSNRVQEDPNNENPETHFDSDAYCLSALKYVQAPPATTEDGVAIPGGRRATRYERQIDFLNSTGPYDLPPGGELKFVMVAACGMMSMDKVAAGGVENEQHLKDGRDSLWAHVDAAAELYRRGYKCPVPPPTPTDGNNSLVLTSTADPGIKIQWPPIPDSYRDPDFGDNDLAGYRVYRSAFRNIGPWTRIAEIPKSAAVMEDGMITHTDTDVRLGIGYYYAVTSYDTGHNAPWPADPSMATVGALESGLVNQNTEPVYPMAKPSNNLDDVRVYPNPFRQHSQLRGPGEEYRMEFVNVPSKCTIRIYTLAGDLVRTIEHTSGSGDEPWGSKAIGDYQVTRYLQFVAPGPYIFQVESHVAGHEGESKLGKFVIIK